MASERKLLLAMRTTTCAVAFEIQQALTNMEMLSDAIVVNPRKIDDEEMGEVWQVEFRAPGEGREGETFRIDIYQVQPA